MDIMTVYDILLERYGERPHQPRRKPMVELIMTMLSHRTTARDERIAFQRLWERFGSWEAIRDAPVEEVTEAISPANYPGQKAPRIQEVLRIITDQRGEPNIDFLGDLPVEEALDWLTALPGVGIKTATLVMLFCFKKPLLPVDTHVHRITQRLGLIDEGTSAEKAHEILLEDLPDDPYVLYNFHVAMLRHGRTLCTWSNPKCSPCPFKETCQWYAENRDNGR